MYIMVVYWKCTPSTEHMSGHMYLIQSNAHISGCFLKPSLEPEVLDHEQEAMNSQPVRSEDAVVHLKTTPSKAPSDVARQNKILKPNPASVEEAMPSPEDRQVSAQIAFGKGRASVALNIRRSLGLWSLIWYMIYKQGSL